MRNITSENKREMLTAISKVWLSRAEAQGLKSGTKKYGEREYEFFIGATAVTDWIFEAYKTDKSSIDPVVAFAGMRNENISEQFLELAEKKEEA